MSFWEGSAEAVQKFWRSFRHSETAANCEVVPGNEANNFHPAVRVRRTIPQGGELLINFRIVPSETFVSFPWFAAIVAEKLSKYDKEKLGELQHAGSEKDFPAQEKQ